MKRKLLIFAASIHYCLLFSAVVQGQNITESNATITLYGINTQLLDAQVTIINSGSGAVNVKVARTGANLAPGHTTYFCWVSCYNPSTFVSPDSIHLRSGDSTTAFSGYVAPNNLDGTSTVSYRFYDQSNPSDSINLTFNYNFNATGINEPGNKPTVSNAYPNPAIGFTSLSYNLNSAKDAELIFYNMIGSVVKEIKLNEKQNTLIIPTSDFKPGVYFYSLIADGKSIATKKLVISH